MECCFVSLTSLLWSFTISVEIRNMIMTILYMIISVQNVCTHGYLYMCSVYQSSLTSWEHKVSWNMVTRRTIKFHTSYQTYTWSLSYIMIGIRKPSGCQILGTCLSSKSRKSSRWMCHNINNNEKSALSKFHFYRVSAELLCGLSLE